MNPLGTVAAAIGRQPLNSPLSPHGPGGFNPFVNTFPKKPDSLVCVMDAGSDTPDQTMRGPAIEYPLVEVRVRHADDSIAEQTCRFIYDSLRGDYLGRGYSLYKRVIESPHSGGQDEGRSIWTFTLRLTVDPSATVD